MMMLVEHLLMSWNNYLGEQRKKGPSPAQNHGIQVLFFEHKRAWFNLFPGATNLVQALGFHGNDSFHCHVVTGKIVSH